MNKTRLPQRYATLSIVLHWMMALLFFGVYAGVLLRDLFPRSDPFRGLLLGLHGSFGLAILALVWVRLLARLMSTRPAIVPGPPGWQTAVAHLTHVALYVLMIGTPLAAWAMLSAGGKPFPYFGFYLPSPVSLAPELAKPLKSLHEWLGTLGYWLIGLHAAAGIYHHYWVRDNTLVRMWPGKRSAMPEGRREIQR